MESVVERNLSKPCVSAGTLTSLPDTRNILTNVRRVIVLALSVTNIAPLASAQIGSMFKKDPGNNQQIEVLSTNGWVPVPAGNNLVTTNVAPAAVSFQGTVFLFGVKPDHSIWVNTETCSGWSGWSPFPPGGATDVAVAPVIFAGSIFVIAKGLDVTDQKLYVTWSNDGVHWVNFQLMDPVNMEITPASAPTAIAMTNPNASPVLFVSVQDTNGNIQVEHYTYSTNQWSDWSSPGFTEFAPSLAVTADPTTGVNTIYLTVVWDPGSAEKRIWVKKTMDGTSSVTPWDGWFFVQPSQLEGFPTSPTAPASFGGAALGVYLNANGQFEGFKESFDANSWNSWDVLPGAPSDVAMAITYGPNPHPCIH